MSEFTPGPWRIGNAATAIFQPTGIKMVADLARLENYRENARLIVSAPEMFNLLEVARDRLQEYMSETSDQNDWLAMEIDKLLQTIKGE